MSTEKSDALVIRLADFSESSRVVTLFTRDHGKISALAKGAKRLKSAFELSLDLLAHCRVVFIKKSTGGLDLLTEAALVRRFQPIPKSLSHLYAGYYVAELLNGLTEEHDPHPDLFDAAVELLRSLSVTSPESAVPCPTGEERSDESPSSGGETEGASESPFVPLTRFELALLREIGQIPDFESCTICQSPLSGNGPYRFWAAQGGLICSNCSRSEYESPPIQAGSLMILQQLADFERPFPRNIVVHPQQQREIRRVLTAAITQTLGRRPKTLSMISF